MLNPQYTTSKVESGSDDPENLGHLDHFLVGQVGLIRKTKLSACMHVTWISPQERHSTIVMFRIKNNWQRTS